MTLEDYRKRLKDYTERLRGPEVNAASDAWKVIEKARHQNVTFGVAAKDTLLDLGLLRENTEKRRRSSKAHTAGFRIYELLRDADRDSDLAPDDPADLEQYVHGRLLPSDEPPSSRV